MLTHYWYYNRIFSAKVSYISSLIKRRSIRWSWISSSYSLDRKKKRIKIKYGRCANRVELTIVLLTLMSWDANVSSSVCVLDYIMGVSSIFHKLVCVSRKQLEQSPQ